MYKILLKKKNSGLTLLEVLIAMFIITVVGVAIVNFQLDIFSLNRITGDNLIAQESARLVLKNMTSEIRSMSTSNGGAYYIDQAGTSSLSFYTNIDSDLAKEKVRYFLEGNVLKRGVIKPINNIYNVNNEIFRVNECLNTSLTSN